MKFGNSFIVLFALFVVLMEIHIGGVFSMKYDAVMTTFGFNDITINGTMYKNVEFILSAYKEQELRGESCPEDFVLASKSILALLPEDLKENFGCRIGVRHEANLSAPELTSEEASNYTFVFERIKELDFYWYLKGKRLELTNIDDVGVYNSKDTRALQHAYNTFLEKGRVIAVPDGAQPVNCCMRNPFIAASRSPTYPEYPAFGVGRHDVTIKGQVYKNVPYVGTSDSVCPYVMKPAIVTTKTFPLDCIVSVAFVGSPTPLPGEDPDDVSMKRSRFQWMADGKPDGHITNELWREASPSQSLASLQNATIGISEKGIRVNTSKAPRCCMDLTQADTITTTAIKH